MSGTVEAPTTGHYALISDMTSFDEPKLRKYAELSRVFTPAAPVSDRDFFAGRIDEVMQVTAALAQPGRHIALYGERGVGKTSLANVLTQFAYLADDRIMESARINCTTSDNFKTIWSKALRSLRIQVPDEWQFHHPDPDDVRYLLGEMERPYVIILDEFDRVEDDETLSLMADTIKAMSDHTVTTKLVIVGVADSIDQLIGEHESVQRALEEILIQRMSESEMSDIILKGLAAVGMSIVPTVKRGITRLAEGLPHYVHLLTLAAAQRALRDDRKQVTLDDLRASIEKAIQSHTLLKDYQVAIQSPRPGNLFSRVLTACALADKNKLGQFTASAVREPMTRIMGTQYDIPAFAPHLKAFTEIDRGSILVRQGVERRYTYRFRNPLLQPFAVLTALSDNILPTDYAEEFFL